LEDPIVAADGTVHDSDHLRLVSPQSTHSPAPLTSRSFIPESPRWLLTKDRHEEAFSILAKYHAEGDRESEFVKAEFAHMQTTIQLEMEHSNSSWTDLWKTAGMRRRMLISAMLGLFTQWSGNTLISYYLSELLDMIGETDSIFKQQLNVASACWALCCGVVIAMLVIKFKRRSMYFVCTIGLLCVYIAWTVSMQQALAAQDAGNVNRTANIMVIFFIFCYTPFYGIGFNALTYSEYSLSHFRIQTLTRIAQRTWSRSGRTPSAPAALRGSSCSDVLRASSRPSSTRSACRTPSGAT
jgi:hypothetical protein